MPRLHESRKRVPVTGGAGFLGTRRTDKLLGQGHEVLCADNLFTGTKRNIAHLHNEPRFEFIRHDITLPLFVEVDEIYNLACPASSIHYQHDPVQTTKPSVHCAINMLGLAKRLKCRILQASASEVYGDPTVHPQTKNYWGKVNPIGLRSCYDEGKRRAETLFFDYHRQHGLDIKVARIFNTYGPRMHQADGRVVSNFVMQALRDKPTTLYGTGKQTRSSCYIDDVIEGLVRLMESPSGFIGPTNLGNPDEFSIKELALEITRQTNSRTELQFLPLPADDPKQRRPDITLAKPILNWQPTITHFTSLIRNISAQTFAPAKIAIETSTKSETQEWIPENRASDDTQTGANTLADHPSHPQSGALTVT